MNTFRTKILAVALASFLTGPAIAVAADRWQEQLLFDPTPAQIAMEESRDRVMIYHGLTDVQVAQAMEQQFDRIQHMMFTGTVITDDRGETMLDPESGQAMVEDDGC
jgi:hypothetical protein